MRSDLLCVVFLVTLAGAVRATETNLILNKPYDYFPVPKYGGPDECTDEDNTIQLTDGVTHYTAGPTVGWGAGINVPVVIGFDLGEPATLSELRFNTTGGGSAGVVDVGLRVFVSLDNQSYVIAGERPPPDAASADQAPAAACRW